MRYIQSRATATITVRSCLTFPRQPCCLVRPSFGFLHLLKLHHPPQASPTAGPFPGPCETPPAASTACVWRGSIHAVFTVVRYCTSLLLSSLDLPDHSCCYIFSLPPFHFPHVHTTSSISLSPRFALLFAARHRLTLATSTATHLYTRDPSHFLPRTSRWPRLQPPRVSDPKLLPQGCGRSFVFLNHSCSMLTLLSPVGSALLLYGPR